MITRFFLNYRRKLSKATLSTHPFLKREWINAREKVLIGNREKILASHLILKSEI